MKIILVDTEPDKDQIARHLINKEPGIIVVDCEEKKPFNPEKGYSSIQTSSIHT